MRMLALVSTAWLLVAAPAFAQDQPADEAIVRELIEITETAKMLDGFSQQIDGMMEQTLRDSLGGRSLTPKQQELLDELRTRVVAIFRESMSWKELEPRMIAIYRKSFTRQEIEGMLAFYRTDVGRAVIAKMPVVMENSMAEMQESVRTMMPKIQAVQNDIMARMRALEEPAEPST